MSKRLWTTAGLFVLCAVCALAQASADKRTIQVDIDYTGSGTVNASHKVFVALWDSSDMSGGPPVAVPVIEFEKGDGDIFRCSESPSICERSLRSDRQLGRTVPAAFGHLAWDVQQESSQPAADRRCAWKDRQGRHHLRRFRESSLNISAGRMTDSVYVPLFTRPSTRQTRAGGHTPTSRGSLAAR